MNLETEEKKFLKDLIEYANKTSNNWKNTLEQASIPITEEFQEIYPQDFGPYGQEEKQIIQQLFNKNLVKLRIKQVDIHTSTKGGERKRTPELIEGIGIPEKKLDSILRELDVEE